MDALPLKPFEHMTAADYAAIGLRCGLEVHQQLLTPTKLFCRCPAGHYNNAYDAEVLRHMRPTLSEMGEYDGTALMEKKTRKNIVYRLHHSNVCTYEFDDTPPFPIADTAVDIALELALILRLNLVNELHIARKQYLDGSIPAGFQRTTILGVDGFLPFEDRKIHVRQLGLEEDSCREVSDRGHDRVYLTDRLGTPLIEVVTEPDMRTPQETAAVCDLIRKVCRSTQKVRRGYGATRQDVNVSVAGGTRIEIKGVPQIWRIPRLIYNEASRQVALLLIRDALRERGITAETLDARWEEVTSLVAKTSYLPIRTAIDNGLGVKCIVLRGFDGILNTVTQEYTTFAKEFSDRVRVIACLSQLPNIAHSDAASESLWAQDWQKLRKRMKADDHDALVVVWGDEQDTETACREIRIRAAEATEGVPSDTRQPLKDGTNGFERVLPGADRMYPDTDLPPIAITTDRIDRVRAGVPEDVWVTEARFRAAGMVEHDAQRLCISPRATSVTRILGNGHLGGGRLGAIVAQRLRAYRRAGHRPERLTNDAIESIIAMYAAGRLASEGIPWVIEQLLERPGDDPITSGDAQAAVADLVDPPLSDAELDERVASAVAASEAERFSTPRQHVRFLAGRLMRELVGRVEGKRIRSRLESQLLGSEPALAGEELEA